MCARAVQAGMAHARGNGCRHGLPGCDQLPLPPPSSGCESRWWQGQWSKTTQATRLPDRGRCWWWGKGCSDAADRHSASWEWVADDDACRMNASHAAAALRTVCSRGRSIMLVGDSLTYQVYHAMLRRFFDGREEDLDTLTCHRVAACVPLPCGPSGGRPRPSLCMRQSFFFSEAPLTLRNRTGGVQATCCAHDAHGPNATTLPHASDVAGWAEAMHGEAAGSPATARGSAVAPAGWVITNAGTAHMAGASCEAGRKQSWVAHQVEAHFNRTTSELASTLARAAPARTELWWLSLPSGAAGCGEAPTKPLDPAELGAACSPATKLWGAGTRAEFYCWSRMNLLDQLGAAAFARFGHGVIAASRPALLRPDARIAGAESIILRRAAAHANKSFEPLAEVMGVPGARYGDCLHFCPQGVPAFYALAVMRFALLRDEAGTPRPTSMGLRAGASASEAHGSCGLRAPP